MVHPVPFTVKVNHVHDFLSSSQRKPISLDDMCQGFRKLQLEFSSISISELHSKADANTDGYVSKEELYASGRCTRR